MKTSKFTEEQIAFALKQAELGTKVEEICRKLGSSEVSLDKFILQETYSQKGFEACPLAHVD
ncbi:hypothetical protein WS67_08480 [Burkholderia singularis]|uniref:Transposase n=1 Tax=Burkholderia singularis TaxID=1503053 RepID=A0A103E5I1_9BURK|nr:hypothetical protein WS67_08480 [Burkholderia singularis]